MKKRDIFVAIGTIVAFIFVSRWINNKTQVLIDEQEATGGGQPG